MKLLIQDLKQALRSLKHSGGQTAISAVGLAVGIVCFTFSLNWLWTEMNYDYFRPEYKDLYVLEREATNGDFRGAYNSHKLSEQLDSLFGEQASYAMYKPFYGKDKCCLPDKQEDAYYLLCLKATPNIAEVLGIKTLSGSVEESLQTWDKFAITESMAKRIFGRTDVVGEQMMVVYPYRTWTYTVGAVIEDNLKDGTNFPYDYIRFLDYNARNDDLWNSMNYYYLVRTQDARMTEGLLERLDIPNTEGQKLVLTPLRFFHKMGNGGTFLEKYLYPLAFTVISLLLLLGALVNLTMIYTSIYLGRLREYMLRRSLGASDWRNAGWMMTEVVPVVLVAILLAAVCMEWCFATDVVPGSSWFVLRIFGWVVLAVCVSVLVAFTYPVLKLRRACRRAFRGERSRGYSHVWLLVVQCVVCAFLLYISMGMQRQISKMLHADLGYDHENILRLYTGWPTDPDMEGHFDFESIFHDLPQEFRNEASCITDAIAMRADLFNRKTTHKVDFIAETLRNSGQTDDIKQGENWWNFAFMEIPYRAIEFFNIRMEGGESFLPEGDSEGDIQVLLNEAAAGMMAAKGQSESVYTGHSTSHTFCNMDPSRPQHILGKRLQVRGKVKLRVNDFHVEDGPMMLVGVPERHECFYVEHDAIYIKHAPGQRQEAEEAVRRVLERHDVLPDQIYLMSFDEYIAENYKEESYYANLLTVMTLFSVLVTVFGLISMMLYSLRLRRRSMAIRRVMGATFYDIFRPDLIRYSILVLSGGVFAYFPAVWFMRKWMEYFYFGEAPGVGLMLVILTRLLLVVAMIVYWQVRRCMNEKPVDVLKPEA